MTTPELKPCPFCGGNDLFVLKPTCHISTPYNENDRLYPLVRCRSCYAEVPGKNNQGPRDDRSAQTAFDAWNTRADTRPPLPDDVGELVDVARRRKTNADKVLAGCGTHDQKLAALANYGDLALQSLPALADTIEAEAARIAEMEKLLRWVETTTATGDGLSADETIKINCLIAAKLKGGAQ